MMPNALPESARQRLSALQVARMSAEDAQRAAVGRLNGLPRDAEQQMRARLADEVTKHKFRFQQLSLLVNKVNQWIMQLRGSPVLEPAVISSVELKNNETLPAAIERVRAEIAAINERLAVVRRAPLPSQTMLEIADQFVERLGRQAKPTLVFDMKDQMSLRWRDSVVGGVEDLVAFACWMAPDAMKNTLKAEIAQMPTAMNAMPALDRQQLVEKLEDALFSHELVEEALVARAHSDGLVDLLRRPDADPRAVLGIAVAKAAQASAVA
jgi:hypothetical protein